MREKKTLCLRQKFTLKEKCLFGAIINQVVEAPQVECPDQIT